jgi:hypothetical protein
MASCKGNEEMAELLVSHGADVDKGNKVRANSYRPILLSSSSYPLIVFLVLIPVLLLLLLHHLLLLL